MDQMYHALKGLRRVIAARDGDCYKRAYGSHAEASAYARHLLTRHKRVRHVYLCWCGKWHLTSKPQ